MALRIRFSITNLVLLTTVIALAITVAMLWREVGPLRRENKRLNEERGTLVIADRTKVNAIRVPAQFAGAKGTTFRVFIPEGRKYLAIVAVNGIPKDGFPEVERRPKGRFVLGQAGKNAFAELAPGENLITVRLERQGEGPESVWFMVRSPENAMLPLDMFVQTPKDRWPKVMPDTYRNYGGGVRGTTESVKPTETLVLLRRRILAAPQEINEVSYSMPEPDRPLDGMMLWIEPIEQ